MPMQRPWLAAPSLFLVLVALGTLAAPVRAAPSCVLEASMDGIVNAGAAEYLESAVAEATTRRCEALLIVIDTPGGMLDETRRIVRTLLGAEVPVLTYVAPSGARAGSAGVFITMAGHVAAMASGTNIGAAHPVTGGGQDPEEAGGKHMAEKVVADTVAFARAVAEERGRNADWAEKAVRESDSVTASQALELKVIDHIAPSRQALLEMVDGTEVRIGDRTVTLATAQASIDVHPMTIRQRALSVLGNPTLAYMLLMIGVLGIMLEIYNPGLLIPGAIGAFALLLAAIGLNALPVNIGAVVLIVIAVGLFVAELFTSTFGLLTLAGFASLVVGASLLIDDADPDFFAEPEVQVAWGVVLPMALVMAGAALVLAWNARRVQQQRSPTGKEGLVGARGRTAGDVGPEGGHVTLQGERWAAEAEAPIPAGRTVRVVAVDGLRLKVEPSDQ
jgi:membrane-bound serine protease (ClpP class)